MNTEQLIEQLKEDRDFSDFDEDNDGFALYDNAVTFLEAANANIIHFLAICAEGKEAGLTSDMTVAQVLWALKSRLINS